MSDLPADIRFGVSAKLTDADKVKQSMEGIGFTAEQAAKAIDTLNKSGKRATVSFQTITSSGETAVVTLRNVSRQVKELDSNLNMVVRRVEGIRMLNKELSNLSKSDVRLQQLYNQQKAAGATPPPQLPSLTAEEKENITKRELEKLRLTRQMQKEAAARERSERTREELGSPERLRTSGQRQQENDRLRREQKLTQVRTPEDIQREAQLLAQRQAEQKQIRSQAAAMGGQQEWGLSGSRIFNIGEALLFKMALSDITTQLVQAVSSAKDFQITISQIRTLSQGTADTFKGWSQSIERVSNNLGMDQMDVARAAYETLSNQITKTAAETEKFLTITGEFSRVTVSSMKDGVDLISSALNGFNIPLQDSERVAGIFFKTIDLGRIKAADLSNSFGRIAPVANTLGISLEEATAALSTLTRQGTKPSDAMTLLTNVMIKLVKPTDNMKKLLASWGTPTGEAAIATYGFAGVLEKLEKATDGSSEELAQLFNEIRSFRGAQLAQGGLFQDFKKDLDQIKNAGQEYNLAKIIRGESGADSLQKELTKISNYFTNTFGQGLLDNLKVVHGGVVTLSGSIKGLGDVLTYVLPGFVAFKAAKAAATFALSAYTLGLRQATIATANLTAATSTLQSKNLGTAISTWTSRLGYLGIALAIGTTAWENWGESAKKWLGIASEQANKFSQERMKDAIGTMNQLLLASNKPKALPDDKRSEANKQVTEGFFKSIMDVTSSEIKKIDQDLNDIRDSGTEIFDTLGGSFKTYTSSIREAISDYRKSITEAENSIKSGQRYVMSLGQTIDKMIFDFKFKHADKTLMGDQRIQVLDAEITKKRSEAESLKNQALLGDKDGLKQQEMQKVLSDLAGLIQQREDIKAERNLAWAKERPTLPGVVTNGKVVQSSKELEAQLYSLKETAKQYEDEIASARRREIDGIQKDVELKEKNLKLLEKQVSNYEKLAIRNKDGNIRPEFRDKATGKIDTDAVMKQFRAAESQILTLMGDSGSQQDMLELLNRRRFNLLKELNLENEKEGVLKLQQRAANDQGIILKLQETAKANMQKILAESVGKGGTSEVAANLTGPLTKIIEALAQPGTKNMIEVGDENISRRLGFRSKKAEAIAPDKNDALTAIQNIRGFLDEIAALPEDKRKPPSVKDVENMLQNLNNLSRAAEKIEAITAKQEGKPSQGPFGYTTKELQKDLLPGQKQPTFQNVTEELRNQLRILLEQSIEFEKNQKISESSDTTASNLRERATQLGLTLTESQTNITTNLNAATQALKSFRTGLQSIDNRLKLTDEDLERVKQKKITGISQNYANGGVVHMASGGIVGLHPGGPRGTDRIPAWLTAEEFIMPVGPSKRFRAQLEDMRAGRTPQYYAMGGTVNTNVGDINVSISGEPSEEKTVRKIGRAIEREVRRGNIKFS